MALRLLTSLSTAYSAALIWGRRRRGREERWLGERGERREEGSRGAGRG